MTAVNSRSSMDTKNMYHRRL